MKAIFVVGLIACGKSHYANTIKEDDDLVIELGDIVRGLTQTETRTFDKNLDNLILKECVKRCINTNAKRVIIVGPRSLELFHNLIDLFDHHEIHFVNVDESIREKRYNESQRAKDKHLSFIEASRKDWELGLFEIMSTLSRGGLGKYRVVEND